MPLDDTGLVCRYYFDEAISGTGPTQVDDDSPNAYHLTEVNYGSGNASWIQDAAGKTGWESTVTTGVQRCRRAIGNSGDAFRTAMEGGQKYTIELVVDLQSVTTNTSRVIAVNNRVGASPSFGLNGDTDAANGMIYVWENTIAYRFTKPAAGRKTLCMVFDTTLTATNRCKTYVDGVTYDTVVSSDITLNDTLTLSNDSDLIIFNRENAGAFERSVDGIMYYAAIYNVAFDATRVSDHHDILTLNDDTPAAPPAATSIVFPHRIIR